MPGLTPEDREALSDDDKALLAQFEEEPDAGEGHADADAGAGAPEGDAEPRPEGSAGDGDQQPQPAVEGGSEDGAEGSPEYVDVESLRIGDQEVPIEQIQALLEFEQWAQSNQEKMQAFGQYLRGEAEFVVRGGQQQQQEPAPKPDEGIDWDLVDPAVKQLYEAQTAQMQEMGARLEQLQNPIQQWQQQQAQEASRQAADQIAQGTEIALNKLGLELSEDEVDRLQRTTADLGILPGMRQTIADPVQAVSAALEAAVWATPEWRDRLVERQVASAEAQARKELAGRVGGTSGSDRSGVSSSAAPVPANMSKEDRQAAMASEIAQYMRGD